MTLILINRKRLKQEILMLDKNKLKTVIKILILIGLIAILLVFIQRTLSRYESDTALSVEGVDLAFWIVDNTFESSNIAIENLYPNSTPFIYTFSISNTPPDPPRS